MLLSLDDAKKLCYPNEPQQMCVDKNTGAILSATPIHDPYLADWKYSKIMEEIKAFESVLDNDHEIAIHLASFGSAVTMSVDSIFYQNPDLLYFYGNVNGNRAQLIQHMNQLNFLLMSVPKADPSSPPRRIGFTAPLEEE